MATLLFQIFLFQEQGDFLLTTKSFLKGFLEGKISNDCEIDDFVMNFMIVTVLMVIFSFSSLLDT